VALLHRLLGALAFGPGPLSPGDQTRTLIVDGRKRSYLIHLPPNLDPHKPTPVVLLFHGAGASGSLMVPFTGMRKKADDAGFIAVYPNSSGIGPFLAFNAGDFVGKLAGSADDVKFVARLLDDLGGVVNVDRRRIFAAGMSNGGSMCYRLAAELSDRIAAIAPVAGTMAIAEARPQRPVSVFHFHGTVDRVVPFHGPRRGAAKLLKYRSVEETIRIWCEINGCPPTPRVTVFPCTLGTGTIAKQMTYGPGREGSEVVLVEIEGGGHTWPGQKPPIPLIGRSTLDISANDLMWEFFQKHPMK
jgi:polyhydroxybutyrate depolymerase